MKLTAITISSLILCSIVSSAPAPGLCSMLSSCLRPKVQESPKPAQPAQPKVQNKEPYGYVKPEVKAAVEKRAEGQRLQREMGQPYVDHVYKKDLAEGQRAAQEAPPPAIEPSKNNRPLPPPPQKSSMKPNDLYPPPKTAETPKKEVRFAEKAKVASGNGGLLDKLFPTKVATKTTSDHKLSPRIPQNQN